MADLGNAHGVGRTAMAGVRRTLAQHAAELLKRDPDRLAAAVEMGVVSRQWLDDPGAGAPVSSATPVDVVQRFLERSVEQRPSTLSQLGLSAIQILSSSSEDGDEAGRTSCLAVVFTDLEGFTSYTARMGDAAAIRLLDEHHREVGPVVRSRGGRIVKHIGDGLLITFPEPEAAVLAGLELATAEREHLLLRAGVHLGDVVVTRDDVIGHVVNVAARVTESAKGGEVVVTTEVRDAIGDLRGVRWGRSRRRRFKGVGEPVSVLSATPV